MAIFCSTAELDRYFQADVTKVDLVKLAQRTLEHLLSWRQNLPRELEVDVDDPVPAKCAPHILILQSVHHPLHFGVQNF